MIVSLRGVNASGKSHIVRRIMSRFPKREDVRLTGRRHPVGYRLHGLEAPLFIPGHYDASGAIGGTDSLLDTEEVYRLVWEAYDAGYNVLLEGRNTSLGMKITSLFDPNQCEIVIVDHPLSECIQSVKNRGASITVETIKRFDRKISDDAAKFVELGYVVHRCNRELAMQKCENLLNLVL